MDLAFKNLSYSVTTPKGESKEILRDVTGFCQAGRLVALMGRSGAGKTSLLDVLACQVRGGSIAGDVLVNGEARDASKFKRSSCYVMQKDILLHTATVREALTTSALLRLPRSTARSAINARVNSLIKELGLERCADTTIGDEALGVKGISGGERRRVSMGLELVTQPAVVFLDEPTSGLDSDTALSVVRVLRRLAAHGRTVICTIHQPSSEIVECFHDLLLLAMGRVCYCGPWEQALPFFADAGFPCPMYRNPADFFMNIIGDASTVDILAKATSRRVAAGELPPPKGWPEQPSRPSNSDITEEGSDECRVDLLALPEVPGLEADDAGKKALADNLAEASQRPPAWYQTWVLTGRFFRSWMRDPALLAAELFQYVFFGLSLGLMYLRLSSSTDKAPFNRASALFFSLTCMSFTPSMTAITSWDSERLLLRRETATRSYSLFAFYFAKSLVVVPFEALLSTSFVLVAYFLMGLQPVFTKFLIHLLIVILFQLCSESVGLLCAVASKKSTYAIILLSVILIYLLSFSGFLLNSLPVYFKWVPKVSFFNYAYTAILTNELNGLKLTAPDGSKVMASTLMPASVANGLSIAENIAVLGAMAVGMRVLGYFLLLAAARLRLL